MPVLLNIGSEYALSNHLQIIWSFADIALDYYLIISNQMTVVLMLYNDTWYGIRWWADELMTTLWALSCGRNLEMRKYGNPKYTVNIYRCPPERYRRSKIQQQMQADDRTRSSSHPIIPGSTSENTVPDKPFLVGREKWKNGTKERNVFDHEVDSKFPGISFSFSFPSTSTWLKIEGDNIYIIVPQICILWD